MCLCWAGAGFTGVLGVAGFVGKIHAGRDKVHNSQTYFIYLSTP